MSNDKTWCVYMHTNKINGKKYVGITSRKPENRWHINGTGYSGQSCFWNAIQKYGWDNFKHEILLMGETFEYACLVERCLIKHYKTYDRQYGYNLTLGGEGSCLTEEQKKVLSERMKGEKNPFYGKHHTEQTLQRISELAKDRDISTFNLSGLKLGRGKTYWTDETYRKLSENSRGEKSGTAKLTEDNVIDILVMIKHGCSYSDIREKYNIADSEISRIKNKIRWAYLYNKFPELYDFPDIPKVVKIKSNNASGVIGVSWFNNRQVWQTYITFHGKQYNLGCFKNKDDAIRARLQAELKYFGDFAPQKDLFEKYKILSNTREEVNNV